MHSIVGHARTRVAKPVEHGLHGCSELVVILGSFHFWQGRDERRVPVDVLVGQVGVQITDRPPDLAKADQSLGALGVRQRVRRANARTRERDGEDQ